MRTRRLSLTGLVIAALLGGPASSVLAQDPLGDAAEPDAFMFVGNSLTYWGDGVPAEFKLLVESDESLEEAVITKVGSGGFVLDSFTDMTGFRLSQRDYDVVVLQDDVPEYPSRDLGQFMETARLYGPTIADAGARTVYYMTWPYASQDWVSLDDIVALHRQVESELGATIAPVGLAFARAEAEMPATRVESGDAGGHPTAVGTYLAAATIYAAVFGRSPEGLYYPENRLSEEAAAALQRIAWETVQEWQHAAAQD